jgi:four helix bundle protein
MGQAPAKFHCKLIVWERAIELCAAVYALTRRFPREELYGLTNQLRRASISIPSNIAEGYGRGTREQYRYFTAIALVSSMELQTLLVIAGKLGFANSGELENVQGLASEVGRMLSATLSRLRAAPNPQTLNSIPKLYP